MRKKIARHLLEAVEDFEANNCAHDGRRVEKHRLIEGRCNRNKEEEPFR